MIAIEQPEVEALIQQRLVAGHFDSVEAVLLQALKDAPLPPSEEHIHPCGPTGPAIVAAFQRSPHKEINIFPKSYVLPISDPVEF